MIAKDVPTTTYGFRLKFHLPAGRSFAGGARGKRRMRFTSFDGRVYLKRLPRPKRNRFGARVKYLFIGERFTSQHAALDCGRRLKLALSLLAAERQFGVDTGKDAATSSFSHAIKEALAHSQGVQLRDDIHGLDVFCEQPPVTRFGVEAYGSSSYVISDYEDRLSDFFGADPALSPKQQLALNLYNLNHFESVTATRFLTLITVVEVLAVRRKRSPQVITFVKGLRGTVRQSGLTVAERTALLNGLGNLTQQSISEACKEFVGQHGSAVDVAFFSDCYSARSELVHDGVTARAVALDSTQLDALVSRLLLGSIVGTPWRPAPSSTAHVRIPSAGGGLVATKAPSAEAAPVKK